MRQSGADFSIHAEVALNTGKLVFAQLTAHLPLTTFRRCVARYKVDHKVRSFTCLERLLVMIFAQLTFRESLRDIEACFRAQPEKLYHMGLRSQVARNTLANANAGRDWRIYAEFAKRLIVMARKLYANDPLGVDLSNTVYPLDSTTIDLCLSLFPWAPFRSTKAAVKLHTLLDLRGDIPTFLHISDGKLHEVNILDQLIPEAGAFYVVNRGYVDFERLARFDQAGAFFVTRAKGGMRFKRLAWRKTDRSTGVICDHTIALTVFYSKQGYPKPLRRVRFKDPEISVRRRDSDGRITGAAPAQRIRLSPPIAAPNRLGMGAPRRRKTMASRRRRPRSTKVWQASVQSCILPVGSYLFGLSALAPHAAILRVPSANVCHPRKAPRTKSQDSPAAPYCFSFMSIPQ